VSNAVRRGTGISSPEGLFSGSLTYEQPQSGFRTAVDSLAICCFLDQEFPGPVGTALDVGCGSGFLSLVMARRWNATRFVAIDSSELRIACARDNVVKNRLSERISVVSGSVCIPRPEWDERFDLVFCNPPFFERGSGTLPVDHEQAIARFEVTLCASELFSAAKRVLRPGGSLVCIYPRHREGSILSMAREHRFTLSHRREVRATEDREARWTLFRWSNTPEGCPPPPPSQAMILESRLGHLGAELEKFVETL
jgi:tRNA1(Val) A37 N6-methylase TrmN6